MLLTAKNIAKYMQVCPVTAYNIINMFEAQGKVVKLAKAKRLDAKYFAEWLASQDGTKAKDKLADIINFVREENNNVQNSQLQRLEGGIR